MLVDLPSRSLLLRVRQPALIQSVIPKAKLFNYQGHNLAVRFGMDEVRVLNHMGIKAPSPILYDYTWPGKFTHIMDIPVPTLCRDGRVPLFFYLPYGAVTAVASNVTAVCAKARPFKVAPVCISINVWHSIIPLKSTVVPSVVWPATCQKMF